MPIYHSWSIVYPYTNNISYLIKILNESLGPYGHSYVSIANVHKPKTMQVITPMESLVLNLVGRYLGQFKLRSHFAHQPFYKMHISYIHCMPTYIHLYTYHLHTQHASAYISYIYIACQHTFIYIHILYIHSMLQHTYLIHTLNMQDECTNKE